MRAYRFDLRRGVAATELAIILPVLVTLTLACVDFGRFAYHAVAVNNAARVGADYGAQNPYLSANRATWVSNIQTYARDEMTNQVGSNSNNLTTAVSETTENNGLRRVRVQATYASFQTLVPWPGIPSSITIQSVSEQRVIR